MAAFGSSAGLADLQQPTPAQLLPAAAVGLAGQHTLGHCADGILAGTLQPPASAALLGLPGTCLGGSQHSSTAGFAAAAALEILTAQQQDLAAACMLQQMLMEAQQQQMLQAQQAQVSSPQDHIFQMWASAYNAAKAVGLQAHEAAACADCAVEQTVGSLAAPHLAPTPATSAAAAPHMGCAGAFGAHPVGAGGKGGLGSLGASAQLQAGFHQPMHLAALHSAPNLKQAVAAGVLGAGVVGPSVVGHLPMGDMLAGLIPGLSL